VFSLSLAFIPLTAISGNTTRIPGRATHKNAASPGPVDTLGSYRPGESRADRDNRIRQQLPASRVGTLEEIAGAVLHLGSPEVSFLIGTDLGIDGGSTA